MAIKVQGITVIDDGRNIINGIGASFTGIVTATTFSGSGASLTNISNTALTNNSVNYGGVTVSLGGTDATPAFDLSDATNYPYTSLTGITTEILGDTTPQLGGNLDINGKFITGTGGINVSGVVTATTFSGSGASLTDIPNGALTNSSIAIGGITLNLGDTDATPAFDLSDATSYPYTSLTGITTEIVGDTTPQLGGNLDINSKFITGTGGINVTGVVTATSFSGSGASLTDIPNGALTNSSIAIGGITLNLGDTDATPAFDLSDATAYPYTSLTGITTEILGDTTPQLGGNLDLNSKFITGTGGINVSGVVTATEFSGSGASLTDIPNAALTNSSIAIGGVTLNLGDTDATPAFDLSDATAYPYTSLTGITTSIVGDTTPQLGGNLDLNSKFITGTGGVNVTGVITATEFSGSGASLTDIPNAALTNSSVSYGGVELSLGGTDATPAFNLSDATAYPYTSLTGITTEIVGDTTPQLGGNLNLNGNDITGTGDFNVTGVITATSFDGNITGDITGNADTATSLATARTFELTGDVVASQISFDGTGNVSLAATIQPNSVELGTDTTGDYVESISGTGNQITVTSGTGEGSTPVISIPDNPTLPGTTVTVATDLQVNRNLNVTGNVTIGGTSATIFAETLKISDPDIIVGFRTDINNNDISNDTTASHGGIAIASTEGSPLVSFVGGGGTIPVTYKKIFWFESGAFTGLATDAWLTNYAFGVGTTSMSAGTKFAVGNIETDFDDITSVRHINSSGVITATTFSGNLPTTDLTGTITNAQLAGSIANDKLVNSSVSYGGIELSLGGTDATPAFNLSDATAYPYTSLTGITTEILGDTTPQLGGNLDLNSNNITGTGDFNVTGVITATTFSGNLPTTDLTGTITNAQLAGSIANDKLANSSIAIGGVTLNLGDTDATPAFNLSDATNYPTSSLSGTITNAQLDGSIANDKLANDSVSFGGISLALGGTDATPAFNLSDATAYPYTSLTGITTEIIGDATPQLGGNLDINGKFITGTGGINVSGVITATSFTGSGSALTGLTGASAATYGDASNVPQIVVDANGRITGISDVTISSGGSTTRTVNRYVATASQTLFPASGTISYTVGYVDVFLNGTKLDSTEFTASNGTTVTLTTGATVDDIVELVAFSSLNLSAATSVTVADESSDTTCFPLFATEATGNLAPKSGSNLTFDSSAGILGATTFAGSVDLSGLLKEGVNITAGKLSDNLNIDLANGMVHLFTTTEDATALPNIRVDGSTSLNSSMSTGEAITVVLITTTAAAGYSAELQIDGSAVTEEWLGGSAPSTGGSGGYDVYTYNIIKTADATFVVLANLVNFA
jgi:hypothetical protein